jgi:hypothetical protein
VYRRNPQGQTPLATIHAPNIKSFIVPPEIGYIIRSFSPQSFQSLTGMDIGFDHPVTEEDLRAISQCNQLRLLEWSPPPGWSGGLPLPNTLRVNFNFRYLHSLALMLVTKGQCYNNAVLI